ncbi:aminotransferase class V-fold PLP-dependent enzyme, partial [Pseudomonas sp. EL_65y_Pfl1_R83]|uniref:aminotransferase class V-fold PLP-dependent enzyme n=1 Tax=Pseudomonas sp. EL_65y_Pfl1_R83 TaxID=3088697 RepID=UPI0030DA08BA
LDAEGVSRVPAHLSFQEAATLPCAGLTAWRALFEEAGVQPGDTVLVVNFGRFGLLLTEILGRIGARIETVEAPWGETVPLDAVAAAIERYGPKLVATIHGDTSTTMAQPLDGFGALCAAAGALSYVDATATIGGMEIAADRWGV